MAIVTADLDVRTGQREITEVMIKGNLLPIERRMAGSAVHAKASPVFVILLVARIAIRGRTLERIILMTFLTGYPGMFPLQFESRQVMVECCFFPTIGRMAGFTGRAKTKLVWIVRAVAGIAVLRRSFEVSQAAHIHMTQHTFHFPMPAGQLKCCDIVIEPPPEQIYSIVTGETI